MFFAGFSFGNCSVNLPTDAVDFLARVTALEMWSLSGFSVGVNPIPGTETTHGRTITNAGYEEKTACHVRVAKHVPECGRCIFQLLTYVRLHKDMLIDENAIQIL